MHSSLLDQDDQFNSSINQYGSDPNQKKKKKVICLVAIILTILFIAILSIILYFFVFTHIVEEKYWRELLHCRKNFEDKTSPMQFATLYNTKRGVILCGGGSDIHQQTARPTLFRSEDDGESWKSVLVGNQTMFSLYSFMEYPPDSEHFIGLIPDYFTQSTDNGNTWSISDLPRTGFSMNFNKDNNKTLIISKNPDEIYRSENGKFDFESITYCFKTSGSPNIFTKDGNLISTSKELSTISNMPRTKFNSQLNDETTSAGCDNLRAITYAGNNTWYMGVGGDREESTLTAHARVFKSTDDGKTWNCVFDLESIHSDYRTIFSVFAFNENEVLIGTDRDASNLSVLTNRPSIYRTVDGGAHWTQVLDTYEDFDPTITIVRSFYLSNDKKNLYACLDCSYSSSHTWADEPDSNTNSIIIVSQDHGLSWKLFMRTETKRLYWITEAVDGGIIASTGEYGQILKLATKKNRKSRF